MNDASDGAFGGSEPSSRPAAQPQIRLLIGYEHARCCTNTDVILPVSGVGDLTSAQAVDAFEPTVVAIADQHAPTCPVCGTRMDFAVWGPHDDEVETRMAFGSRGGDAE